MERDSTAELVDGSVISIRQLMPDDGDEIVRLYETLNDDERYFRFFTMCPAHLQARARSITECNNDQYSLGAFDSGDSGKLLGVANFIACKDSGYAEVAVVVAHDQHLRGVGTALLHRLGEIARNYGFHHFVAEVLAENHPMLRVLSDVGWPCTRHLEGSVLHVEIDLDAIAAPPRR
jgi:RimJ/RimL family protein N-acetyltransferase